MSIATNILRAKRKKRERLIIEDKPINENDTDENINCELENENNIV